MHVIRRTFVPLLFALVLSTANAGAQVRPPMPLMPIPTARQIAWQEQEMVMFVHFTVNTYTDKEWGDGTEDPAIFNPTKLDARQWARTAKENGFKTVILTAKHHDGFNLWPSKYTDHSVEKSPWKGGKGDVVRELADATKAEGVRMGLYLSPWDRHEPSYGETVGYNQHYAAQLTELLTQYGPLAEVWFDGAKGADAKDMVYDFDAYWALVRQYQPGAVMFSDAGPDVRWIGNERGFAGETCWSMIDRSLVAPGKADSKYLNEGDINGKDWVPGESDVSIRKGWFWHANEQPKTVDQLLDIYFHSVGRNTVLLLNVPPEPSGRFSDIDVQRLGEFRRALDTIFKTDLAKGRPVTASVTRGNAPEFGGANITDGKPETYWTTNDDQKGGVLEVDLGRPTRFDVVRIQEPIRLGQRVKAYRVEAFDGTSWKEISRGTTIGYKRLDRVTPVTASRVRLVVEDARACPLISEFGLYNSGR